MFNFFKKKELVLFSPLNGEVVDITKVPDAVFAEKMVGDGLAIEPTDGLVLAPCDGKVVQIFPTNHAVGIETKEGVDILIHLGIDTVEFNGDGFERLIQEGDMVTVRTPLIKMDIGKIRGNGKHAITPVIVTNMEVVQGLETKAGQVTAGKDIIMKVKIK